MVCKWAYHLLINGYIGVLSYNPFNEAFFGTSWQTSWVYNQTQKKPFDSQDSTHPNLCNLANSVAFAGGSLNVVGLPKREKSMERKQKRLTGFFRGNLKVTYGNTVRFGVPGLAISFVGEEMVEAKDLF